MAKKLFIGNLAFSLTEDQLREIFAPFGNIVSLNIVMDKFSGRSKGFAFVEYDNEESAQKALQSLDGSEQAGRNISVKEAIPRPENTTN
jgi:cold-inducible RNA-binding protein